MKNPKVSVILAVRNGQPYLQQAISSVLQQTFVDFEFLILDDGSKDNTIEILNSNTDPRIHIFQNEQCSGLAESLNLLLDKAVGTYIARMDADDECVADRFFRQVSFLDLNPDIGFIGSVVRVMDENNKIVSKIQTPLFPDEIVWEQFFRNPFIHPTVMFRKSVMDLYRIRYNPEFKYAQDYDLFTRMVRITKGANLPLPVLRYRIHSKQASSLHLASQNQFRNVVWRSLLSHPLYSTISDVSRLTFHEIYTAYIENGTSMETVADMIKNSMYELAWVENRKNLDRYIKKILLKSLFGSRQYWKGVVQLVKYSLYDILLFLYVIPYFGNNLRLHQFKKRFKVV